MIDAIQLKEVIQNTLNIKSCLTANTGDDILICIDHKSQCHYNHLFSEILKKYDITEFYFSSRGGFYWYRIPYKYNNNLEQLMFCERIYNE